MNARQVDDGRFEDRLIPREHYMRLLRDSRDVPLIKVLTGMRRCGKSTLMRMAMHDILDSGVQPGRVLFLDFDEWEPGTPKDAEELIRCVDSRISPGPGTYLFFDEVQNVDRWEVAMVSFHTLGADVYLTGSNSNLLSTELSTRLSGRCLRIDVHPLSFSEYVEFRRCPGGSLEDLFEDYVEYGGLPFIASFFDENGKRMIKEYTAGVCSDIVFRDVVQRCNVRNPASLSGIVRFLFRNIGDRTSASSIAGYIESAGQPVSRLTVEEYLEHVEHSCLMSRARRMDSKTRSYMVTSDKFYAEDLGIRNALVPSDDRDVDGVLENLLYNELRFRYGEVCVYSVEGREVDFMAMRDGKPMYFQACVSVTDGKTLERELKPLLSIPDNHPKTIVTWYRHPCDEIQGVRIVSILEFLTECREGVVTLDRFLVFASVSASFSFYYY